MEDKKYQVIFCGELLPGAEAESVKNNLAKVFKVDKNKIEPLFSGGKKVVKKDATRDLCEKTKKIFESAGAVVSVIPQGTRKEPPPPTDTEPEAAEPATETEASPPAKPVVATLPSSSDTDAQKPSFDKVPAGDVNKTVLLLLTFSLGFVGIHKFYLARNIQGILYLLFCWTGLPGLISLIEFFIYASTSKEKLNSRYKTGSTPLVIITAVFGPIFCMAMIGIIAAIAIPLLIVSHQDDNTAPARKIVTGPPAAAGKTRAAPRPPENYKTIPVPSETAPLPEAAVSEGALNLSGGNAAPACSGKIKGLDFSVEHASIQSGVLHLEQGRDLNSDREIIVFMFLENRDVSNQRMVASADKESLSDPHIHLRWKTGEDDMLRSDVVMKGYDLNLEFGAVTGKTVQGKIDLKVPGNQETRLTGTFTAEVMDK